MQVQDYLPFFQDLLLQYYQLTLENPVYAACLAVAVWLLTSIFYSLRIGVLNRRNSIMLKARLDLQNELAAAQQQIQALQDEISAGKEQIEQEVQRTAAQQERIAELATQLSESILALAAQPELGQQGLSVSKGLEVEHLWQRYSGAVKLMGEGLIEQRKANAELQEAISAETAKLAEKDLQLQATQTRFDLQKQQLAKLEAAAEEHKAQLAQQQESAQQSLANIEAKHQIDLARLVVLEQQAQEWSRSKQQPAQVKTPDAAIKQPEAPKPVEIKAAAVQSVASQPNKVEAKPAMNEVVAPEPASVKVEMPRQQPVKAENASAGVAGKFKSLFAGAKQKMEKLDGKLGVNNPQLPEEEPAQTEPAPQPQNVVEPAPVSAPTEAASQPQQDVAIKAAAGGLGGKFKNMFGSSKKAAPVEEETPVEAVAAEPEQPPVEIIAEPSAADKGAAPGKLKGLFGKFKRNA